MRRDFWNDAETKFREIKIHAKINFIKNFIKNFWRNSKIVKKF